MVSIEAVTGLSLASQLLEIPVIGSLDPEGVEDIISKVGITIDRAALGERTVRQIINGNLIKKDGNKERVLSVDIGQGKFFWGERVELEKGIRGLSLIEGLFLLQGLNDRSPGFLKNIDQILLVGVKKNKLLGADGVLAFERKDEVSFRLTVLKPTDFVNSALKQRGLLPTVKTSV